MHPITQSIAQNPTTKKEKARNIIIISIIILILIIITILVGKPLYGFFTSPERIKEWLLSFGIYSPIAFILLQTAQVLLAPIPGQVTGIASGYLFGIFFGTIYSMIGAMIGSLIAFFLSRKLGRPFVERILKQETIKKFDYVSGEKGEFALFMIFLLPALPDDAVCFIAGLTKIPIRKLMLIAFFGRLPGYIILNMVGAGIASSQAMTAIIIFSAFMVVSFLIYIYRRDIERIVKRR